MVVYGEYLFLENFAVGLVVLYLTKSALKEEVSKVRIIISSICCGLISFSIFISMHQLLRFGMIIFFNFAISAISFGVKSVKKTAIASAIFFLMTTIYGGVTLVLINIFSMQGSWTLGGGYYSPETFVSVFSASMFALLFVIFIIKTIKAKRLEKMSLVETKVVFGKGKYTLTGLIDSGNFLVEPLTGSPVAIVSRNRLNAMINSLENKDTRFAQIPYSALGTERGFLSGYRADYIEITGLIVVKPIIAAMPEGKGGVFNGRGEDEIQILLPRTMLERGLYGDY